MKNPQYISIKDKLPPQEELILTICLADGDHHDPVLARYFGIKHSDDVIMVEEEYDREPLTCTHWYPTPENLYK